MLETARICTRGEYRRDTLIHMIHANTKLKHDHATRHHVIVMVCFQCSERESDIDIVECARVCVFRLPSPLTHTQYSIVYCCVLYAAGYGIRHTGIFLFLHSIFNHVDVFNITYFLFKLFNVHMHII